MKRKFVFLKNTNIKFNNQFNTRYNIDLNDLKLYQNRLYKNRLFKTVYISATIEK